MSSLKQIANVPKFVNLHRILGQRGYQYGIENHCSLIVDKHPITQKRALMTSKYGMDWSYITENDLFSVDIESKQVIDGDIDTQYTEELLLNMLSIHIGTALDRHDIECIIHTHPLSVCTLIGLNEPYNKILNVHQNNVRFNTINKIGYDSEYCTFEVDEYDKYAQLIGTDNDILFLSNHGCVVTADCIETAWDRFYFLDLSAQIQLNIYNTHKDIKYIPEYMMDFVSQEYTKEMEAYSAKYHFQAAVNSLK